MTPTISTTRLSLRAMTKPASRQLAWLRDPNVVRFSEQRHRDHTLSTQLRYISQFGGASHLWGIHHIEAGELIGSLSASSDEPNNVADVGIMIGEARFWGKGFGAEAWRVACEWLLDKDCGKFRKLEAGCMRSNEAMLKIMQGSRFVEEGERKNHFLLDGNPVSAVLFGRMR